MPFFNWLRGTTRRRAKVRCQPPRCRLLVEGLEDRTVPASYSAASVPDLIAAVDAANLTPEADTITLAAGKTYTLTQVNNRTHGPTGLPTVAATSEITILGSGATIERSTAVGTLDFRLFNVAAGASLTLQNLTLQHGAADLGGAICNQGSLALGGVTVRNNTATAAGGGIWSSGSLSVEHSTIQSNQALGVNGTAEVPGGPAAGGGLYIAGGSASLTDVTLDSNTARGGDGGGKRVKVYGGGVKHNSFSFVGGTEGGNAYGGALYAAGGTVSLLHTTVTRNTARGGSGGGGGNSKASDGIAKGGGLYLAAAASVSLDAFTFANVKNNSPDDISGSYTVG